MVAKLYPLVPGSLRWADTVLLKLRRELPATGLRTTVTPPPNPRPILSKPLKLWLSLRGATCLERSLILQRWFLSLGRPHDVLIGVGSVTENLVAHAWLDNEDPRGHAVVTRVSPT